MRGGRLLINMKNSIESLYTLYKQDIFNYLVSQTRNPEVSEDLTSEVFISAIKSLPSFKGNSDIKTWLFSIARHKWYEHIRADKKQKLAQDFLLKQYIKSEQQNEDIILRNEIVLKVAKLLEKEKDVARKIVLMRIEGYSYFEISKKLNISESSARVVDHRTKRKIREILLKEDMIYE